MNGFFSRFFFFFTDSEVNNEWHDGVIVIDKLGIQVHGMPISYLVDS